MLRKIICLVFIMTTCLGYVFSQTEKSSVTLIKDNMLFYDHEVVKGQTLYGLSKMYQVGVEDIVQYNPTAQQGLKTGEHIYIPFSKQKVEIYAVKKGETLYTIARSRGVKENELRLLNPEINETLRIGQEIVVPLIKVQLVEEEVTATIGSSSTENLTRKQRKALKEETEKKAVEKEEAANVTPDSVFHTVEKGETLYGISKKYTTTVDEIKKVNPHIGETINIGDRIYIPVTMGTLIVDDANGRIEDDDFGWTENDEPIINEGVMKTEYTVYLLMPLYLSKVDLIEPAKVKSLYDYSKIKPFSYIQFYEAMQLAADDISTKYPQIKINLYVEDIETSTQLTELIHDGKLDDADMVIGPFQSSEFSALCQYAKGKNILLVNPFSDTFTSHDATTYKAVTSYTYMGESFAKYILEKSPNANIIFANNQSSVENKQISECRSGMQKIFNQAGKKINIQEVNIKNNNIPSIKMAMSNMNRNFLFVFFEGELMITNFIQNLNAAKMDNLTLVAPEKWLKYDNIEAEYFMAVNTHYISQCFVDYANPKVIRFIDAFRDAYDTEPVLELYAFQGYDFTYYFLSKLCETGTGLQPFDNHENLLSTKFHFVPSVTNKNMMENTFIHIFKIKDFKFINAFSDDETDISKNSSKPMK